MADADFFNESSTEETSQDNQVYTIGDKQYTPDELNELVSLGNLAKDAQVKYNTDLTKVWPEYTKSQQKIKELESERENWSRQQQDQRVQQGQQLSPDEIKERALAEAADLGLLTSKNAPQVISDMLDGRELRSNVDSLVEELDALGISTDRDAILDYMEREDVRNPIRAVDELYDYSDRVKEYQNSEMDNLKNSREDFATFNGEINNNRQPERIKIENEDQFKAAISEILGE